MMDDFDAGLLSTDDKLKYSFFHHTSLVLDDVGTSNTLIGNVEFSKEAKILLSDLFFCKLQSYAADLEAFALHAKRATINVEDVKLLFRNNSKLLEKVSEVDDSNKAETSKQKTSKGGGTKRKRSDPDDAPEQQVLEME